MGQDEGQVGAPVESEQKTPDEIRHEIEEALAANADVKARARRITSH
jgi:hypothetical protein